MAVLFALALDMHAHRRVEDLGGVNMWGYRGPVARQRQPSEIRVEIVGGTRAFGWGEPAPAMASQLRRVIMLTTDRRGVVLRPVVVINLARLGVLPDAYRETIERFSYLRPDYVCIYDDLGVRGAPSSERMSGIFELTGYTPILPLVIREKGMRWAFGDVARGYAAAQSRPDPTASRLRRAAGRALESVGDGLAAADRFVARVAAPPLYNEQLQAEHDAVYVEEMMGAIEAAREHAGGVVVAVSPAETADQARRLRALESRLNEQIGAASWLRFVNLGGETKLLDDAVRLDGWNYSSAGITLVAERIAPALLSLIAAGH